MATRHIRFLWLALASIVNAQGDSAESVVYSTLSPRGWDVFLSDGESGQITPLAPHPALDYDPTFSPDGRWVVFTSERRGNPDLWALDLDEKEPNPILLTPADSMQDAAAFSPDGAHIAFVDTRDGNAEIYSMPFDPIDPNAAFAMAVNLTRSPRGDFRPAFSPDGRRIAFCSDRAVPSRTGWPDAEIARARGLPETAPWPTGGDIYLMDVDGSNPVRLTDADGWDGSPSWSPDGQALFFYSERRGLPSIWRMAPDGVSKRRLGCRPAFRPCRRTGASCSFACCRTPRTPGAPTR